MGLLLSILVTCVGVLELLEVYHRIKGRARAWVCQPTQDLAQIKRSYVKGLQNECQNVYKDIENYCRKEGIPDEDISKYFNFRFQWNDLESNPKSLTEVCEQTQNALEYWKVSHTANQNVSAEEIVGQVNLHSCNKDSFFPLTKSSSVTDVTKIGNENGSNLDLVSSTFNSPDFWRCSGGTIRKKRREETYTASSTIQQLKTTIVPTSEYPILDPKCQRYDDSDFDSDSTSTISQTGLTGKDLARASVTNHEYLKLDVASGHVKVVEEKQPQDVEFNQTTAEDSLISNDVLNIVDGIKRDDKKNPFRKKQIHKKSEITIDNSVTFSEVCSDSTEEKRNSNSEKNQRENHSDSEASKAFWVNEDFK